MIRSLVLLSLHEHREGEAVLEAAAPDGLGKLCGLLLAHAQVRAVPLRQILLLLVGGGEVDGARGARPRPPCGRGQGCSADERSDTRCGSAVRMKSTSVESLIAGGKISAPRASRSTVAGTASSSSGSWSASATWLGPLKSGSRPSYFTSDGATTSAGARNPRLVLRMPALFDRPPNR